MNNLIPYHQDAIAWLKIRREQPAHLRKSQKPVIFGLPEHAEGNRKGMLPATTESELASP